MFLFFRYWYYLSLKILATVEDTIAGDHWKFAFYRRWTLQQQSQIPFCTLGQRLATWDFFTDITQVANRKMPKCVVLTCKNGYTSQKENTPQDLRWFSLPKSPALRGRWLFQINREDEASFDTKFAQICSSHFRPEDFLTEEQNRDQQGRKRKRRNLCPGAVPTINMRPHHEQGLSFFFLF